MKNIKCKKIPSVVVCLLCCATSCQNYYDYSDLSFQCAAFISFDWLYNLADYVYLIELGEMLGTWTSPNKSLGRYGVYDVWSYSIVEAYKGTTDNYYMFFRSDAYDYPGMPEFFTGSYYYVFLNDYSDLDPRVGFPDYFISLSYCNYNYGVYAA